jgi:hypothetical protein
MPGATATASERGFKFPFPCGPAGRRRGGALPPWQCHGGPGASSIALSEWESPPSAGERDNLPRARLRVTPRRRARGPATARAGPGLQNKGRQGFFGPLQVRAPDRPFGPKFKSQKLGLGAPPDPGRSNAAACSGCCHGPGHRGTAAAAAPAHRPGTGMRRQPHADPWSTPLLQLQLPPHVVCAIFGCQDAHAICLDIMARRDAVPQHRLDQRADAVPRALSVAWAAERPLHPIDPTERTRQVRCQCPASTWPCASGSATPRCHCARRIRS